MSCQNQKPGPQRVIFALLLVALLSLTSCGQWEDRSLDSGPEIALLQNELVHYDEQGQIVWVLRARSVQYFDGLKQTQAEGVEVRFLKPNGEEALIVQADSLIFYNTKGDLRFRGNLKARDPEGLRFSTEEAYWEQRTRLLRGSSPVEVEREDLMLTGEGFEYRPDEGILTIQTAHLKLILKGP